MKMKLLLFATLLSLISGSCQLWNEAPAKVEPLGSQRTCETVDDCITVSSSCNGCCQQTAVNRKDSISYEKRRAKGCSGYSGGICDCDYLPVTPVCENSKCGLVPTANPQGLSFEAVKSPKR